MLKYNKLNANDIKSDNETDRHTEEIKKIEKHESVYDEVAWNEFLQTQEFYLEASGN